MWESYHRNSRPETTLGEHGPSVLNLRRYLKENILPQHNATVERIARQAKRYAVMDGDLYRRSANQVLLECISQEEGRDLLVDILGGECGIHASSHTLV